MILNLIYKNPITDQDDNLILKYPICDYLFWKSNTFNYKSDEEIYRFLDYKLKELDCTREYDCGRPMMTNYPMYNLKLSSYYFYLIKIQNQFKYNEYIDKIINRHIKNIEFEYNNPFIPKSKKNYKIPKYKRKDMFSNETILVDENGNDIKYKKKATKKSKVVNIKIDKNLNAIATFKFK